MPHSINVDIRPVSVVFREDQSRRREVRLTVEMEIDIALGGQYLVQFEIEGVQHRMQAICTQNNPWEFVSTGVPETADKMRFGWSYLFPSETRHGRWFLGALDTLR